MKAYAPAAVSAWKNKNGGAYRLALFAKELDAPGSGKVRADELRSYALSLGVKEQTLDRWLRRAIELRVLIPGRGGWISRVSEAKAIAILSPGVTRVGRAVEIDPHDLAGKNWRAAIWKAYYATTRGNPISRATMQDITGVAPNVQRRLDIQAGIAPPEKGKTEFKKRNYAIIQKSAKQHLSAYQEFGGRKYFAFRVKGMKYDQIAYRLPNSYHVADQLARKGRLRKINAELSNVVTTPAAQSHPSRIYCSTPEQAARSDRELTYTPRPLQSFRSVFWTEHTSTLLGA